MIKILFNIFRRDQQSIKSLKLSKLKRIIRSFVVIVLIFIAFGSVLSPLIFNADKIQQAIPINLGNLAMMLGFYLIFIIAFISALGFLFSSGYLDKNLNNYIVLPIKKFDFIIAKLALVYYNVMAIVLLVTIPFAIIYFTYGNITFSGILIIILYTFTVPLITIYVTSFIIGTVMLFINKLKNKAIAKNVLYALFFIVVFSIYLYIVVATSSIRHDNYLALINFFTNIVDKVNTTFFYSTWATDVLNNADYLKIVWMLLVTIIGFVFVLYFQKVYFKGSIGFNEGGQTRRRQHKKVSGITHYSMTTWFFIREFKEIFKTGTYFFNSVFANIIIVVIYLGLMGYFYFFQGNTLQNAQELNSFVNNYLNIEIVILITLAVGTFFTIFNNGAASVFSRDAKVLDFLNTLPLNQSRAFFGKVLFHALVEFLTLFIFMMIPMLVIGLKFYYIIVSVIIMIIIVLATIFIPICVDLRFSTLDWESETAVVKRAKSIVISMIIHFVLTFVIIGGGICLITLAHIDYKVVAYIITAFYLIMFAVMTLLYRKLVSYAFRKVKEA